METHCTAMLACARRGRARARCARRRDGARTQWRRRAFMEGHGHPAVPLRERRGYTYERLGARGRRHPQGALVQTQKSRFTGPGRGPSRPYTTSAQRALAPRLQRRGLQRCRHLRSSPGEARTSTTRDGGGKRHQTRSHQRLPGHSRTQAESALTCLRCIQRAVCGAADPSGPARD